MGDNQNYQGQVFSQIPEINQEAVETIAFKEQTEVETGYLQPDLSYVNHERIGVAALSLPQHNIGEVSDRVNIKRNPKKLAEHHFVQTSANYYRAANKNIMDLRRRAVELEAA